jgi:hypothetical protein
MQVIELVVQCALIDPVDDQLDLWRSEFGSAFGHFVGFEHVHEETVICISGSDHCAVVGTGDQAFIRL